MSSTARLEPWKTKEVRKYLEREFPGARIAIQVRGSHVAYHFIVLVARHMGQHEIAHQLLVTRQFFDRCDTRLVLRETLKAGTVSALLEEARDRTITLY